MSVPRSEQFDDVYFSVQDGLAETRHVFLDGNGLPERWMDKSEFVIAETGFGTGLNFLAAWKLFVETATPQQKLHFISFEKYPLTADQIAEYLTPWAHDMGEYTKSLAVNYPAGTKGTHVIAMSDQVHLTLYFGDVNDCLPQLQCHVDCWFLDGFKPSANPDMWSEKVFEEIGRLSSKGTSLATFTAAGFVRRGLEAQGFAIQKTPGFGRKREMITGVKQ